MVLAIPRRQKFGHRMFHSTNLGLSRWSLLSHCFLTSLGYPPFLSTKMMYQTYSASVASDWLRSSVAWQIVQVLEAWGRKVGGKAETNIQKPWSLSYSQCFLFPSISDRERFKDMFFLLCFMIVDLGGWCFMIDFGHLRSFMTQRQSVTY